MLMLLIGFIGANLLAFGLFAVDKRAAIRGDQRIPENTLLLVSSSFTVTFAHHALKKNHRGPLKLWLAATVALGACFIVLQAYEYHEAYSELGLTLGSGIYGATFFMLTGFHGAHVTIGAIMLSIMLIRIIRGHFDADKHFGFEAASWYWHFVDVVWIGLFIFVYVL